MNADERQEIAASVAAHAELGPRYEAAVAEGLVERIGEEIDKRIDARLRGDGQPARSPQPTSAPPPMTPFQPVPPPVGAPWPTGPQGPLASPAQQGPVHKSAAATVAGTILALGSMGLGVGATAVIASNVRSPAGQAITILLIWVAIIVINAVHARSYWPQHHRRSK